MNQKGDSRSDRSCAGTEGLSIGEPTSMKKPAMTIQSDKSTKEPATKHEKHVHYTINVYGPTNLQVGDHNKMEKRRDSTHSDDDESDDNDEDEDEVGTSVKDSSGKSKKKRHSQDSAPGEEQQLKPCKDSEYNDEEATRSKLGYGDEDGSRKSTERLVSGEVRPSQGPSSASGTSCNVDAAPSTQYTPPMKLGADTGAKVAANNFPYVVAEDDSNEQSEEPATLQVKTSKTKEGSFLEESVNMQSQRSWLTKSSEGQKNIVSVPPVVKPNVVQKHNSPEKHGTGEKPIAAVRPQAVVKPMELGDEPDNDNEELTDPKSLVRSVNTSAKALGNAVVSGGISQSTVVKQVDAAPPQTRTFSVNQSQNNKQNTNQVSVRDSLAQTNAKVVSMYDSHEETNVKVAQFGFTRFSQQQQFCTNISPSNDRVRGNMDSIDGQEVEEAQEASLTNQKRSGKSASNATSPKQQTGAVRNSGVSVDQEYDLLETDSFEEDHFGPVTGSSSSNKSAKKECVVS
ncbi:hypothetical protein DPMN_107779 [Dreissena polymorpha]|uniref:Uncharacterized protein n=2 Tax=Dreissena polymorpha TaxID=45954 RepID=A0A9D4K7J1_DREPO|nr:hypothetical protein DPMN_107779 [Dreissena polymorpha]